MSAIVATNASLKSIADNSQNVHSSNAKASNANCVVINEGHSSILYLALSYQEVALWGQAD